MILESFQQQAGLQIRKPISSSEFYSDKKMGEIKKSKTMLNGVQVVLSQKGKESRNVQSGYFQERFAQKVDELQYKKRRRSVNRYSDDDIRCPLCQQLFPIQQVNSFTLCKHHFCANCSLKHIKYEMSNANRVQCPIKDCGAFIDGRNVILSYLTADQLEKLNKIQQKAHGMSQMNTINKQDLEKNINMIGGDLVNSEQLRLQDEKVETTKKQKIIRQGVQSIELQQIELSIAQSSPKKSQENSKTISDSQACLTNSQIQDKRNGKNQVQQKVKQPNCISLLFPIKIFNRICTQIWSNEWSNFFKMLPVSILLVIGYIVMILLWSLWVFLYFVLVWLLFVPFVWSIAEIFGCFARSFKNNIARNISFVLCLIGFPPIIVFFYILIVSIIVYDALFKIDMRGVLEGKMSLLFSCRKVYLSKKYVNSQPCTCGISQNCLLCEKRHNVFCFLFWN